MRKGIAVLIRLANLYAMPIDYAHFTPNDPDTATQMAVLKSDWASPPLSREGFPSPGDACVRETSVSRYREQSLNRYDQDRTPQEEHEIRDDPGCHLPDVGNRSDSVCRDDQRYRR